MILPDLQSFLVLNKNANYILNYILNYIDHNIVQYFECSPSGVREPLFYPLLI